MLTLAQEFGFTADQMQVITSQAFDLIDRTQTLVRPTATVLREIDLPAFVGMLRHGFEILCGPRTKLEFDFEWELPEPLKVEDPRSAFRCAGSRMAFAARLGLQGDSDSKLAVEEMTYRLKQDDGKSRSFHE